MAKLAVFASGNGSNFEAIAEGLEKTRHELNCLVCNKRQAGAVRRAEERDIPILRITYAKSDSEAERARKEEDLAEELERRGVDLIALAGFMRVLTPPFVDRFAGRIVNIHPALLPRYPGLDAVRRSVEAGDTELGVTIHYVDHGVDTGEIIEQESFARPEHLGLEEIEARIHQLEHRLYPSVLQRMLDTIDEP
jgi:phosphoribosylglycinamide formyltransferase-1